LKTLRILLLLLLTMMLPLRGALADFVHCAGTANAPAKISAAFHDHASAHAHHDSTASHMHAAVSTDLDSDLDPALDSPDKCNLCTASCSAPPFMIALPSVAVPIAVAGRVFPALATPPPNHPSEGQDRPPRSI